MRHYLYGLAAGLLGTLLLLAGGIQALSLVAPQHMPAPAISRLDHLDEKLHFLRGHPGLDPRVLAVGSSITWRQFDGAAFAHLAGGGSHVLNGGTAFLKTHQTRFVTDFYLDHFRNVRTLVQVTNVPDFRRCHSEPAEMFDPEDAAAYAFGREPALLFYLRYFAPMRYLRTLRDLPAQRRLGSGELALDDYGAGPIGGTPGTTQKARGLFYGRIAVERDCVEPLVDLARQAAGRGIRYVVVFAPVHPGYFQRYPDMREETLALAAALRQRLTPLGGLVLEMQEAPGYAPADFYDAFHLHWPAVRRFSAEVADQLGHTLSVGLPPVAPPQEAELAAHRGR